MTDNYNQQLNIRIFDMYTIHPNIVWIEPT